MKPQISSSELAIVADQYLEKAWHLTSVLLSIGRPVCVSELAGECSLFPASPEFVEFLCSIPNSPIFLSGNGFVLPSMAAFTAFVEFLAISTPKVQIGVRGAKLLCGGDVVKTYIRKRKKFGCEVMPVAKKREVLSLVNENERVNARFCSSERAVRSCFKVVDLNTAHIERDSKALPLGHLGMPTKAVSVNIFSDNLIMKPLILNSKVRRLGCYISNDEEPRAENKPNTAPLGVVCKGVTIEDSPNDDVDSRTISDLPGLDRERTGVPLLESLAEISALLDMNEVPETNLMNGIDTCSPCVKTEQQNINTLVEGATVINAYKDFGDEVQKRMEELAELIAMDSGSQERVDNFSFGCCKNSYRSPGAKLCQTIMETSSSKLPAMNDKLLNDKLGTETLVSGVQQSITAKSLTNFSATMEDVPHDESAQKQPTPLKSIQHDKLDIVNKKQKGQKDLNAISRKHKSRQMIKNSALMQEKCENIDKFSRNQHQSKSFPDFNAYVVEEEEGSGGYGIVYRAKRKSDGVTFAIKCPHVNAHKHHCKNELKMLERFGGRNFVIKYEGSLKSGSSDCFVLEHVEHDRPEVLKREINVFQLQWYGYCMFRALASLHKQGVFHRDVKPGNFLFSCKSNKGYLIDFNLAKDLHQKNENNDKLQTSYSISIKLLPALPSKTVSPSKRMKILGAKPCESFKAGVASGSNLESKTLKKKRVDKLKVYDDLCRRNSITSQGAEASGLTSAKDITPSAEKLREPLPCQGRKELINLAQEAMQSPNLGATIAPASNRKRVAASPGIIDRKLAYISPMPVHSSGVAISGVQSMKSREVKAQKEGPCAGTKGFRAPEVLLRSLHQGPKIDVWSAGVTLLYLITGKMPFAGDPEQNMKDIVKLRGNEELWEVAKLHNRETSLPVDLLDVRYISSTRIKDWCAANTKRPSFMQQIPASLFDLIEKCLAVNPRLRITADEALRHEFFTPCHEALRKQRSLRQGPNQDSSSNSLSNMYEVSHVKPVRPPYEQSINVVK